MDRTNKPTDDQLIDLGTASVETKGQPIGDPEDSTHRLFVAGGLSDD